MSSNILIRSSNHDTGSSHQSQSLCGANQNQLPGGELSERPAEPIPRLFCCLINYPLTVSLVADCHYLAGFQLRMPCNHDPCFSLDKAQNTKRFCFGFGFVKMCLKPGMLHIPITLTHNMHFSILLYSYRSLPQSGHAL